MPRSRNLVVFGLLLLGAVLAVFLLGGVDRPDGGDMAGRGTESERDAAGRAPPPDDGVETAPRASDDDGDEASDAWTRPLSGRPPSPRGEPRTLVSGRVLRADGAPASGARVTLLRSYERRRRGGPVRPGYRRPGLVAVTDPDGSYRIRLARGFGLRPGEYTVLAESDGAIAVGPTVELADPPKRMPDLVLGEALVTSGEVVDVRGRPLAGVEVSLLVRAAAGKREGLVLVVDDRSDAMGKVTFADLPRDPDFRFSVSAKRSDLLEVEYRPLDPAPLLAGRPFRLVLHRGLTVVGRALEPDGSPASGLRVLKGQRNGRHRPFRSDGASRTDAEGRFRIDAVETKNGMLVFRRGNGPARYVDGIVGEDGSTIDIGSVVLASPVRIAGVVVGDGGSPLPGATVRVLAANGTVVGRVVTTDSGGRFAVGDLPRGSYTVEASVSDAGGLRSARREKVARGTQDVHLELARMGTLVIRLRLARDVRTPPRIKGMSLQYPDGAAFGRWGTVRSEIPEWRLDLAPGTHSLTLTAEGFEEVDLGSVVITAGRETTVDALLTPLRD